MADGHAIGEHKISVTIVRKAEGDEVASEWSVQRYFRHEREALALLILLTTNLAAVVNSEHAAMLMRDAARIVAAEEQRQMQRELDRHA